MAYAIGEWVEPTKRALQEFPELGEGIAYRITGANGAGHRSAPDCIRINYFGHWNNWYHQSHFRPARPAA